MPSMLPLIRVGPWPSYLSCLNVYVCICKREYSYRSQALLRIQSQVFSIARRSRDFSCSRILAVVAQGILERGPDKNPRTNKQNTYTRMPVLKYLVFHFFLRFYFYVISTSIVGLELTISKSRVTCFTKWVSQAPPRWLSGKPSWILEMYPFNSW